MKEPLKSAIVYYQHPVLFYILAVGGPMMLWSLAACVSHFASGNSILTTLQTTLVAIGFIIPITTAFSMIFSNPILKKDFLSRIWSYNKTKLVYILVACSLMFASLLLAQFISLFFGYSISQFSLLRKATFSAGYLSGWVLLLLAPFLEEFAWHTYGTDCLRNRFNLFATCMIFTIAWILFHSPLLFMKGYYHSHLLQSGLLYTVSYFVSFFPFVVIVNWLYYKTERMILIAVLLHFTVDVSAEMFATHPMSKVIQTIILLIVTIVIILKNPRFFFNRDLKSLSLGLLPGAESIP